MQIEDTPDELQRLGLLASAIAGRVLRVASAGPGEPAWTDGKMVFIDGSLGRHQQVEALAVQASLLAAGSLHAEVMYSLKRRPAAARRYLAVEGHRALAGNKDILPPSLHGLINPAVAARTDSPAASLALALSREPIADPPRSFGTIHARRLLEHRSDGSATNQHAELEQPHQRAAQLVESDEDATDLFSSPVGGGGALGRLLGRLLTAVRRINEGTPAEADPGMQRARAGTHASNHTRISIGAAGALEAAAVENRGVTYPEWDAHRRRYRQSWCTVQEVEPLLTDGMQLLPSSGYSLRRPLARLGMSLDRCRRRTQGDDLDIDAAVEARVEALAGSPPDDAIYVESIRRRRDLSVLVLLDTSGSAAEAGANGETVHEQQRAAAAALTVALHDLGDRVALYAYHSRGRAAVHLVPVKRFEDDLDNHVMQRLHGLMPVAYSRLGAAIRHGAYLLKKRGGTSRRLLVVLSDGLAYDHGYEPEYGAADARRALAETRRAGTACLCLSIGAGTDAETLRRVFGSAAHANIPRTDQLSRVIGPLFRSALRSAEVRRQVTS